MYEDEEVDYFFHDLTDFVIGMTNFKNYVNMNEASRQKWVEKLTLQACYTFSPRKNYDISKDTIRSAIKEILEAVERGEPTES